MHLFASLYARQRRRRPGMPSSRNPKPPRAVCEYMHARDEAGTLSEDGPHLPCLRELWKVNYWPRQRSFPVGYFFGGLFSLFVPSSLCGDPDWGGNVIQFAVGGCVRGRAGVIEARVIPPASPTSLPRLASGSVALMLCSIGESLVVVDVCILCTATCLLLRVVSPMLLRTLRSLEFEANACEPPRVPW